MHSSIRLGREYLTGLYLPHAAVNVSDFPSRNRSTSTNSSLSSPAREPLVSPDNAYEVNFTLSASIPALGPDASCGERMCAHAHTWHTCTIRAFHQEIPQERRRGAADNELSVILHYTSHCCPLLRFIWSLNHGRSRQAREGWSLASVRYTIWFLAVLTPNLSMQM